MSKYIVFKCKQCGAFGISELHEKTLQKPAECLKKKPLKCLRCMKSTLFKNANVYGIYNVPKEAMDKAKRLNLEGVKGLPLEEKKILAKIGENYVKDQTIETHRGK